jgi:hypothetical protein
VTEVRMMTAVGVHSDGGRSKDAEMESGEVDSAVGLGGSKKKAAKGVAIKERERDVVSVAGNSGGGWSCQVRLRFEFDTHGNRLQQVKEVVFGNAVRDPALVENLVKQAQRAILNPSVDAVKFLDESFSASFSFGSASPSSSTSTTASSTTSSPTRLDSNGTATGNNNSSSSEKENELKFSKNVVCLEIRGAAVNLTLIDLPGIIRSVDRKEDTFYIDLIQELVRSYISNERAIIVATITCKDEIENQV